MSFRKYPRQILITLVTAALILTACNAGTPPPPTTDANALNTAIVGTTIAQFSEQFTQTALAQPTNTPVPTDTPIPLPTFEQPTADASALPTFSLQSPTPGALPGFTQLPSPVPAGATQALGDACSNNVFEGDITIPDGSVLNPGEDFQKIWKIRNTGTCLWDDGYTLVYIGGSNPDLDPYNFEFKKSSDFVSAGEAINIGINLTAPCTPGLYEGHWRMRNDGGYYFGSILSVYIEVKDKCK
jgi:hypothetical protein